MTMAVDTTSTVDSNAAAALFSQQSLTPLQEECFKLLKAKQYKSCEILARMELAKADTQGRDARVAWALLGDCAQLTQQYRRAISFYRRIQVFGGSHTINSKYRFKEAQCLQALGNVVEASSVLEMVPREHRTLTIHMTLGHLYLASGRNSSASECFVESLVLNPYTLEAMEWLAVLGTDKSQVFEAVKTGFCQNNANAQDQSQSQSLLVPVVKDLIHAHFAEHRHQSASSLQMFSKLEQEFPNNVYLLLKIATLQVST
jgi:tetratricopeptide (TPR) repeat protein